MLVLESAGKLLLQIYIEQVALVIDEHSLKFWTSFQPRKSRYIDISLCNYRKSENLLTTVLGQ